MTSWIFSWIRSILFSLLFRKVLLNDDAAANFAKYLSSNLLIVLLYPVESFNELLKLEAFNILINIVELLMWLHVNEVWNWAWVWVKPCFNSKSIASRKFDFRIIYLRWNFITLQCSAFSWNCMVEVKNNGVIIDSDSEWRLWWFLEAETEAKTTWCFKQWINIKSTWVELDASMRTEIRQTQKRTWLNNSRRNAFGARDSSYVLVMVSITQWCFWTVDRE